MRLYGYDVHSGLLLNVLDDQLYLSTMAYGTVLQDPPPACAP